MIHLLCGKICSGKSYYAKVLKEKYNAVILSTDEATFDLINNEQGEFYNTFAQRVNTYLLKKAIEISKAGANVILDWGFWTKSDRASISKTLKENDIEFIWHYIDISDETWHNNIEKRNKMIEEGNGGSNFYVDAGLLQKLESMFEVPSNDEIHVWYKPSYE